MSGSFRRAQAGQSLVLAAIMMAVLIGFTGLAIDGGETTARQELDRSAADGASLAGAYAIAVDGETEASATTDAGEILTADGLPTSDLTLSFLDSSGAATATPSLVATVRAVVADSASTFFLGAVGIASISVTASADASTTTTSGGGGGGGGSYPTCAICLMKTSGTVLTTGAGVSLTLNGALVVNSNSASAVSLGNNASVVATLVTLPSGGTVSYGPGASTSPAPTTSPGISDPLPALAVPVIGGSATSYTAPAGTPSISPGLYSNITVPNGSALTLTAGTYVVTGALTVSGGSLTGNGVTIYLACSAYPTACASGGAAGGAINLSSGSLSLTAPTSGTYNGISVFGDRHNTATSTVGNGTITVGGTWYAIAMTIRDTHSSDHLGFGQLIVAAMTFANNDVLTFSGAPSTGSKVVGLSS